ncbi:YHYH domain-containing protein [Rossellomorea aquimaris]|uniref:YHYH domain-containing protein n=1 Tax=Rossellomorea aquimaris TaxID=189382 RepID=UPI0007D0513B|nr:YHYH domain-containing protein [Rossellomorea aquimaris]
MKKITLFSVFFLFLFLGSTTSAHSGRTDSRGGHNKTANGTYHCHSGECLENAKEEAFNVCYPLGRKDGPQRIDHSNELEQKINKKYDSDNAEYLVPFCLDAYEQGYEETYIPTFWEKYYWIFILASFVSICIGVFINHKKRTT